MEKKMGRYSRGLRSSGLAGRRLQGRSEDCLRGNPSDRPRRRSGWSHL